MRLAREPLLGESPGIDIPLIQPEGMRDARALALGAEEAMEIVNVVRERASRYQGRRSAAVAAAFTAALR